MSILQRHRQQYRPLLEIAAKHPCVVESVADVMRESQITSAEAHNIALSERHRFHALDTLESTEALPEVVASK